MSEPGPVETINAILNGEDNFILLVQRPQLERFRDEIVALRKLTDGNWVWQQICSTRDAALEEATALCLRKARDYVIPIGQDNYHDGCVSCAAAIRKLKGEGHG